MSDVQIDRMTANVVPGERQDAAPVPVAAPSPPPDRDANALQRARDTARLLDERARRLRAT